MNSANLTIALCGNPNCGKTTLFNLLTGENQKVGNWPGVTVQQKTGVWKSWQNACIVDTPGTYSLNPYTEEEKVSCQYLHSKKANLLLNVVDCTQLVRSLFLTTQLLQLGVPMVVALNFCDEAEVGGMHVDEQKLQEAFGCPFVKISAAKRTGIAQLCKQCKIALQNASTNKPAARAILCKKFPQGESAYVQAQRRYDFIERIAKDVSQTKQTSTQSRQRQTTQKIDAIVLNKWLAFPIFAAVIALVFFLSVGSVGSFFADAINNRLTPLLQNAANVFFLKYGTPRLASLVSDGIVAGVMSVVGFLPQVTLLFAALAMLEASGYTARIAFITDGLLGKIGLGGRSVVAMILGCGCSVPAITSSRTIKSTTERNSTITLAPFMPCSAKLAIIAFLTSAMPNGAVIATSFYLLSIAAIVVGGLFWKGRKKASDATFIMELPTYRCPSARNVLKQTCERAKSFLTKAGTVILAASVVLWFAQHYNFKLQWVDTQNGMLATIGKIIAPLFYPLGFNDGGYGWQFAVATLSGFSAKETVVATLQLLLPCRPDKCISALGAYSFVAYNVLTAPCVAAISAIFAERGKGGACKTLAFQIATAYAVSLTIYQVGSAAQRYPKIFVTVLTCLLIAAAIALALKHNTKTTCGNCDGCNKRCSNFKESNGN